MPTDLRLVVEVFGMQVVRRERGIPRYLAELLGRVAAHEGVEVLLRTSNRLPPLTVGSSLGSHQRSDRQILEAIDGRTVPTVHVSGTPIMLRHAGGRLMPQWITDRRLATMAIMYDVIPSLFPETYFKNNHHARPYFAHLDVVRSLDRVASISASTRDDLVNEFGFDPERISVVGAGVDLDVFSPGPVDRSDPRLGDPSRGIVLCIGGDDHRKNVPALIAAWGKVDRSIRARHRLVVVCSLPSPTRKRWRRVAAESGLERGDYTFTGEVETAVLVNLYRAATLVVAPSLYEGFGLPVAEAAAVGAPVICSATSALPSIIGAPESTFDPHSVGSISARIADVLGNEASLRRLAEASKQVGPTLGWEPVVDRFLDAARAVARPPRPRTGPRAVTVIAPSAPAQSGVATYTDRLLPELAARRPVHRYVDHLLFGADGSFVRGHKPATALGRWEDPDPRSEVVAVIGNSLFHTNSYRYALEHPCHVWLHDLALDGIVLAMAASMPVVAESVEFVDSHLTRTLRALVGPATVENHLDRDMFRTLGQRMIERVARGATSVIVSTERSRMMLTATGAIDPGRVTVIPLAFPVPTVDAERSPSPAIVVVGSVDPPKEPDTAIRVLSLLSEDVTMDFVGRITDPDYRTHLVDVAQRLGVAERVTFTGTVEEDDYWRAIQQGWVGLQLRSTDNGEASAAINDLLACGTPVVTTVPTAVELPAGAVAHLGRGTSSEDVADRLGAILFDDDINRRMSDSALAHARSWGFADVAAALDDWLFPRRD